MARLAVLASGDGSNFQALVEAARAAGHRVVLLASDRPGARVLQRAARLGVASLVVSYSGRSRTEVEAALALALERAGAQIVALAGFMRLLGATFVGSFAGRLVNVHPSLLPAWPGTDSIRRAWDAGDELLGVSAHFVDEGMDTGPIIAQVAVPRGATLEDTIRSVHDAEHMLFPRVVVGLLDAADVRSSRSPRQGREDCPVSGNMVP